MLNPEQWRVTILKVRPRLVGLVVLLLGLILGLLWAYGVAPTVWTNAEPIHLHRSYQVEWVKMVADQYAYTGDDGHAAQMLALVGDAVGIIDQISAENTGDRELIALLNRVRGIAQGAGADQASPVLAALDYGFFQTLSPIVLVAIVAVLGAVGIVLWGMYAMMFGFIIKGLLPSRRRGSKDEESAVASGVEVERRRVAQESAKQRVAEQVKQQEMGLPEPVSQFMSAYIAGDDYYDDSFSIEDESGGFLGETGAGISESIGVGAPKKVTAIEVWLFDKNDIRTVTKVIMSEHAYNDEALRAKLAPKGEAVMARPGLPVQLETQTLKVVATIRDMEYGGGAMPVNSYFERMSVDIAAYAKEGATSAPGTAISDMYEGTTPL